MLGMILGFNNFNDISKYFTKHIGSWATTVLCIIAIISNFIETYVYYTSGAIWFLWGLYLLDFISGILVAIFIKKDFKSKHVPRVIVGLFFGSILIFISYQAGVHSPIYSYLGSIIYAVLVGQNIISIYENASQFGVGSPEFLEFLKRKFSLKEILNYTGNIKTKIKKTSRKK